MTFRTSRLLVTKSLSLPMSQKGCGVLAPVDHSGIIQPVPTKMMRKYIANYKNISASKFVALMVCSVELYFLQTWLTNSKLLSKYMFNIVASAFYSYFLYMATLKVVQQIISSKAISVPQRHLWQFMDSSELNVRLRFSDLPCDVRCSCFSHN